MNKAKVFLAIFILISGACKKSNNSGSNSINYSIDGLNDNSITNCSYPAIRFDYDSIGGPNCALYVWRQARDLDGNPSNIMISLDSNCDLTRGSLPYSTSNFSCMIMDDGIPLTVHQISYWEYPDRMTPPKGHLTLQITYRNGGRIKGTITGDIYSALPFERVAKLDCDFDVVVPVR